MNECKNLLNVVLTLCLFLPIAFMSMWPLSLHQTSSRCARHIYLTNPSVWNIAAQHDMKALCRQGNVSSSGGKNGEEIVERDKSKMVTFADKEILAHPLAFFLFFLTKHIFPPFFSNK